MSETEFLTELIREIMAQGYDRQTAGDYAVLIGDTPVLDEAGNILVMDQTASGLKVVATLRPLAIFSE